jgi:hypothetical protein
MRDLTTFCATSDIKPVLTKVYVYEENDRKFAVATDAFRLVEWEIENDFLKKNITPGFYTASKWKNMCKAYNKKNKDIRSFIEARDENILINKNFVEDFPNYKQIIPTDTKELIGNFSVNMEYFIDFIKMMPQLKFKELNFNKIKQNDKMLYYEDYELKIILMNLKK